MTDKRLGTETNVYHSDVENAITGEWMEKNILSQIQDIPESEVCENDVIVYNGIVTCGNSEKFGATYSGIITSDGMIKGIWGELGTFIHKLDEAPESYGDIKDVKYYRREDIEKVKEVLHEKLFWDNYNELQNLIKK